MAVLQRTKIHEDERLDLTDYENIEDFVCADFGQMFKQIFNSTSYIVRGFRVFQDLALSNALPTASPVYVEVAGSVLLHSDNNDVMFVGVPGTAPVQLQLTSNTTNYIELDLTTSTASADTRAFWDQTAANGAGEEYAQVVDTVENLNSSITINTVGFSGGTKVPVAEIEVNNAGVIVGFYDRRNLFGRLGKGQPFNNTFKFPFSGTRNEGLHTLTLTGGAGTYISGETISGPSGIKAIVVTGGTTSITIKNKTAAKFTIGEVLTGATSAAARTLSLAKEDFNSGDKSIITIKDALNAIYTEIERMKFGIGASNRFWYEDPVSSLADSRPEMFLDGGGVIAWATPNLSFTAAFTIAVTGTSFVNTILQANSPLNLSDGDCVYVDINKNASVNITPTIVQQVNYQPLENRFIIARRVGTQTRIEDRLI